MIRSTAIANLGRYIQRVRSLGRWLTWSLAIWLVLAGIAGAQSFRLLEATVDDVQAALATGQITCRELVQQYLDRIEAYDQTGPALNAVQYVNPRALQRAESLDIAFAASGPTGPLHCIPVLLKDQVETRIMPTTYGSARSSQRSVPQRLASGMDRSE